MIERANDKSKQKTKQMLRVEHKRQTRRKDYFTKVLSNEGPHHCFLDLEGLVVLYRVFQYSVSSDNLVKG